MPLSLNIAFALPHDTLELFGREGFCLADWTFENLHVVEHFAFPLHVNLDLPEFYAADWTKQRSRFQPVFVFGSGFGRQCLSASKRSIVLMCLAETYSGLWPASGVPFRDLVLGAENVNLINCK